MREEELTKGWRRRGSLSHQSFGLGVNQLERNRKKLIELLRAVDDRVKS